MHCVVGEHQGGAISNIVCGTIEKLGVASQFLLLHIDASPPGYTPREAQVRVLNSISATPLAMTHPVSKAMRLVWRIYMDPPSLLTKVHTEWIKLLNGLKFESIYGQGIPINLRQCAHCKSGDHPSGLCPLRSIPGIYNPPNQQHEQDVSTTANKVGRGGERGKK